MRWTVGRRSSFEIRDSHHSIAWLDGSCSACCFSFVAEPGHTFPILNCPVAGRKNIEFRRQAESATHRTSFSPSSRRLPRHPNPCATKEQYRIFGIEIRELVTQCRTKEKASLIEYIIIGVDTILNSPTISN